MNMKWKITMASSDTTDDDLPSIAEVRGILKDYPARTFGGYTAEEVAKLCDMLAVSADRMTNSYSETASIARRARDAIRFLLGMEVQPDV